MHREFPIECTCSHRTERFQLAFARRAAELLPSSEDTAFAPRAEGLVLFAETETALERPLEILREVYGDQIRIGCPVVRYHSGPVVEEPYMGIRVLCANEHFAAVKADLEKRGASIIDAESTRLFGIVRATAPLAALLGYPRKLADLTSARAQQVMWFSHYAPLSNPPPGGSAA